MRNASSHALTAHFSEVNIPYLAGERADDETCINRPITKLQKTHSTKSNVSLNLKLSSNLNHKPNTVDNPLRFTTCDQLQYLQVQLVIYREYQNKR